MNVSTECLEKVEGIQGNGLLEKVQSISVPQEKGLLLNPHSISSPFRLSRNGDVSYLCQENDGNIKYNSQDLEYKGNVLSDECQEFNAVNLGNQENVLAINAKLISRREAPQRQENRHSENCNSISAPLRLNGGGDVS